MPSDPRAFDPTLGPERDHIHVIVRLREGAAPGPLWAGFLGEHASMRHMLGAFRSLALRCAPDSLDALRAHADVESLFPDHRVVAAVEQGVPAVGVPPLWEEGLTGKGIRLAILDTGIDRGHPDFEGRIAAFEDFTGCGVRDDHGHGTFVSSIAAGSGEASRGRNSGVAPAAALLIARVLNSEGRGRMSDVMAGLMWALTREAQVINLSLRTESAPGPDDALAAAIGAVVARGIVVSAASADSIEEALLPVPGGEAPLRCACPGARLIAARAYGTTLGRPVGEKYIEAAGASATAALVSGVCTLLLEGVPEAGPAEIARAISAGSRSGVSGPIVVNALAALAELRDTARRR